jgi:hypothetical protein
MLCIRWQRSGYYFSRTNAFKNSCFIDLESVGANSSFLQMAELICCYCSWWPLGVAVAFSEELRSWQETEVGGAGEVLPLMLGIAYLKLLFS